MFPPNSTRSGKRAFGRGIFSTRWGSGAGSIPVWFGVAGPSFVVVVVVVVAIARRTCCSSIASRRRIRSS
ncbi:hypothetical protein BJX66DRAFT_311975 [Aspergillus keveii]|uniref:Uncharacterized protein n=1 Tax=Aspergillus keveii TaxID=714993 RepID=A0ABR4FUJ3_9EURO